MFTNIKNCELNLAENSFKIYYKVDSIILLIISILLIILSDFINVG